MTAYQLAYEPTPPEAKKPLVYGCFDIETRSLGFHNGGAFKPIGSGPIAVSWRILGGEADDMVAVHWDYAQAEGKLMAFFDDFLSRVDVVLGHNIRDFDLPVLNGWRLELGMRPFKPITFIDTLRHLKKTAGRSRSMANLAASMGIKDEKPHVTDHQWRRAGAGDPDVLEYIRRRCHDDVVLNIHLYEQLRDRGWLGGRKVWTP